MNRIATCLISSQLLLLPACASSSAPTTQLRDEEPASQSVAAVEHELVRVLVGRVDFGE